MKISVVIATYNRKEKLRNCLTAVINQKSSLHEIIVVDDGSTDETAVMMANQYPGVQFIQQPENLGPAAARNAGIEAATGEIIAFTDDDCVPPEDWLAQLSSGFDKYPEAGAIGGVQLPPLATQKRSYLAKYEAFITHTVYQVGEQDVVGHPAPGGTNNLAIPRAVLDRVGHFDTRFPIAAGEDADLLHRIAAAGYDTVCMTTAVSHHPNYSFTNFCKQQLRRGKGAAYYSQKYGEQRPLIAEIIRLILYPLMFFQFLWKYKQPANAFLNTVAGFLQTVGRLQGQRILVDTPKHVWQSSASPIKLTYLQKFVIGNTVLDAGSGAGFYSNWLTQQGYDVTAVDRYPTALNGRRLIQADLTALPFEQKFDTVLCFDVLEHVENEQAALKELRRLTRKRLLFSVPNENDEILRQYNLTFKHHVDKTHFREYSLEELDAKFRQNGFNIIYSNFEGPVNPAILAEFIRPKMARPLLRFIIKASFKLNLLKNSSLFADIYIVAEPTRSN